MNIRIVNLRYYKLNKDEVLIKVDRTSVLGNPFYMNDETQRDIVCDKYQKYFEKIVSDKKDINFINELRYIYKILKSKDVALGCWCYPRRCHAETIVKFIKSFN